MCLYIQPNVAPPSVLVCEEHLGVQLELVHLEGHLRHQQGNEHKLQPHLHSVVVDNCTNSETVDISSAGSISGMILAGIQAWFLVY